MPNNQATITEEFREDITKLTQGRGKFLRIPDYPCDVGRAFVGLETGCDD
jgi:hypothetical protein